VPRNFADIIRRVSRGYDIPTSEALRLVGRPIFTIDLDSLIDEEASDVFVLRPSWATGFQAAVGAEFSHVQLFNPIGSGVIGVVEEVWLEVGAAMRIRVGNSDVALASVGAAAGFRDRRIAGAPAIVIAVDTNVANQVVTRADINIPDTTSFRLPPSGVVLSPGTGIGFEGLTVNISLQASVKWREESA